MNKSYMRLSIILASILLLSLTGCTNKEQETTTEATTPAIATEEVTTTTTTTAATETEEIVKWTVESETTTAETTPEVTTTKSPLKSSIDKDYIGETYDETFSIRPDMKDKVLDVTLNINSTPNVLIKSSTTVGDKTLAVSEVAIADTGEKVYITMQTFFPVKFLVLTDGSTYILNDDESFYLKVTPDSGIDTSGLSAADFQYNYTITSNTADYVTLDDKLYIRMQARDNSSGLDLILYFDENGVLSYVYTLNAVFGEALTKLEYTQVEPSYFQLPKSYTEYSIDEYNDYLNKIRQDLGFNPVTTTATSEPEEEPETEDTTQPAEE